MSRHCPVSGCLVTAVDDSKLLCRADWALVPKPVQRAVNTAYDRGRGLGSPALRAAQKAAIAAARRGRGSKPGPSVYEIWVQAGGGTKDYDPGRYHDLLREHGVILHPGDEGYEHGVRNLPCGWPHRAT